MNGKIPSNHPDIASRSPRYSARFVEPASLKLADLRLAGARYVSNGIALNGSTFRDSHSVSLEHLRGMLSAGLALNRGPWGASLSNQVGTDQFEGRTTDTRFGSLELTYLF